MNTTVRRWTQFRNNRNEWSYFGTANSTYDYLYLLIGTNLLPIKVQFGLVITYILCSVLTNGMHVYKKVMLCTYFHYLLHDSNAKESIFNAIVVIVLGYYLYLTLSWCIFLQTKEIM